MLRIKYKERNKAIDDWKIVLETLVMAHEFIEDETVEQPILTTKSETLIGENEISKYMEEIAEFQNVWYCGINKKL